MNRSVLAAASKDDLSVGLWPVRVGRLDTRRSSETQPIRCSIGSLTPTTQLGNVFYPLLRKDRMHFVIVGAGALGSIIAAHLAEAGEEVSLIARGERAALLAEHGIGVIGHATFRTACNIVTDPSSITSADVVIVAVKTYDTESALANLSHISVGSALSIQNGILKNAQLASVFGEQAVLGAVGLLGGAVGPTTGGRPGPVNYTLPNATIVGELDGSVSSRAQRIVMAMVDAGLVAEAATDITSIEWSKFVGWSGMSALAVLTRLNTHQFLADPETARLAVRVMRETAAVASAEGAELRDQGPLLAKTVTVGSEDDAVAAMVAAGRRLAQSAPELRQSILQDADRGRRLEVHETLGHTLGLAESLSIDTPTLDVCCRVLRTIDRATRAGES